MVVVYWHDLSCMMFSHFTALKAKFANGHYTEKSLLNLVKST